MSKNQFLKQVVLFDIIAAEAKKGKRKGHISFRSLAIIFEEQANGDSEDPLSIILKKSVRVILNLKQADTHFTIGEALTCAAACWQSDALLLGLDVDSSYVGRMKRPHTFGAVLDKLLQDCKTDQTLT